MTRASTVLVLLALLFTASDAHAQQARLIVTVVDYNNVPVPDAQIRVSRRGNDWTRTPTLIAREKTNASGVVVVEVEPLEEYELLASRPGYDAYGPVHATPPAGDIGLLMRLRATERPSSPPTPGRRVRYGVLTGRVMTASATPMPNQHVLARSVTNQGSMFGATTGPDGRYRVEVPPGRYTVKAGDNPPVAPHEFRLASIHEMHDAAESPPVVVSSGAEAVVDLWLPPAAVLYNATITVFDDAGQPAKDTEVEVFWRRDPLTPNLAQASFLGTYHTNGEPIVLPPTLPGPITIIARSLADTPLAGITSFDLQAASRKIRVLMHTAARVSGRVEFVGRETPLQGGNGIRVIFQPAGSPLNLNSITIRNIEPEGDFRLYGLVGEGCLRIEGLPAGWRLKDISQDGVDLTGRLFTLEPGDMRSDVIVRIERGEPPPSWEVRNCT